MYQFQKYSSWACQTTHILKFFGLRQKFDASGFFFKIQNFMWEKIVAGVINGLSIKKIFDEEKIPMRSTFEISTQIILLKIDGFLKGWILNITPLKVSLFKMISYSKFWKNLRSVFLPTENVQEKLCYTLSDLRKA